jgi:hypothetical protein
MSLAVAAALAAPLARADDDLQALRAEIAQMKQAYEQRIAALEARVAQAEAAARPAEPVAAVAPPTQANAFNPETSVILSGNVTNLSRDASQDPTGRAGRERRIQGFLPAGGNLMPATRSFNLGESELAFAANIDHLFRGNFLMSVHPDNTVSVEEANVQTLGLGTGSNLKFGRFFSGIGYANEQHAHMWDFADAALPYQAFFAGQLGYDGAQLKWLAPTPLFLEFGAEAGRAGGFPATDATRNKNGFLSGSLFVHAGDDVGFSNSWRAGLSLFASKPRDRDYQDADSLGTLVTDRFSGTSNTAVADFVWKWAPEGNPLQHNFKFQTELFRRREAGALSYDIQNASLGSATGAYRASQGGGYAQGVWQFRPLWRVGYRYDWLSPGSPAIGLVASGMRSAADFPLLQSFRPHRHSLMVDWSPSEFSTLRFQVARDDSRPGGADNQVWLQYIVSMGAHGAHKF